MRNPVLYLPHDHVWERGFFQKLTLQHKPCLIKWSQKREGDPEIFKKGTPSFRNGKGEFF